ncbi:hypothetical protein SAMN06295970_11810 [Noviherbaspirillum suwonense]|uniref:Transposase n=1 Tax=Noviherbaspirillum suwonense TaxID=1224511 RepID=A0ABY1QIL1_9BURK|nr:hypothetical protein SAMN06295970_11810 [Noviherbaspirillum suwonense]
MMAKQELTEFPFYCCMYQDLNPRLSSPFSRHNKYHSAAKLYLRWTCLTQILRWREKYRLALQL